MKTKLCFFNLNMNIGGVERQLYYLINGLIGDNYDIYLVLCKKEGAFISEISKNISVIDLATAHSFKNIPKIIIKLRRVLSTINPDIFISFHSTLNCISVLACCFMPTKLICCFPGYVSIGRIPTFKKFLLKNAKKLVAVSNGVKNSMIDNMKMPDKNITVIENCIDIDDIMLRSRDKDLSVDISNYKFVIISVGRLSKDKSFDTLIRASAHFPDDCIVLIIGDGENRLNLENLVKQLDLSSKVLFLGSQNNPYKYMAAASAYVLSASSEGLPTVLLEAMLIGIPCICPDYKGRTDDVVAQNITGYVFKKGDFNELVGIVNMIHSGSYEDNVKTVVNNARAYALSHSIDKYVQKYKDLFNEL